MAIDAVMGDLLSQLLILATLLGLMAGQAVGRKCGRVALRLMNIVAGRAGHGARLETSAFLEQLDLIAMNVNGSVRAGIRNVEIPVNVFSREK
jgi:hypothetical protein